MEPEVVQSSRAGDKSRPNTGLGHDDDGNIDDKRVAGWVMFAVALGLIGYGAFKESPVILEYARMAIWPAITALGIGVVEKFRASKGG